MAQASQEAAEPGDEIAALVQTMGTDTANVTTFKEGDRVLVTEGDLKNLDGTVVSVNDDGKLMVKASLAELAGNAPLTIDAQHVVKFFQVGVLVYLRVCGCKIGPLVLPRIVLPQGIGSRVSAFANASMALALSAHTPWVNLVSTASIGA